MIVSIERVGRQAGAVFATHTSYRNKVWGDPVVHKCLGYNRFCVSVPPHVLRLTQNR